MTVWYAEEDGDTIEYAAVATKERMAGEPASEPKIPVSDPQIPASDPKFYSVRPAKFYE